MPPPDLELSTFNVDGIDAPQIWKLGRDVLDASPNTSLYGRADLSVSVVHKQKLRAIRDDEPPRHVVIIGWPTMPDLADQKSRHKAIAMELKEDSEFFSAPSNGVGDG